MTVNETKIILAFINQNEGDKLSVVKFNGETCEFVGETTCTDTSIDEPRVCFNGNFIQVSFALPGALIDKIFCMRFVQAIAFPPANIKAELLQNNCVKLPRAPACILPAAESQPSLRLRQRLSSKMFCGLSYLMFYSIVFTGISHPVRVEIYGIIQHATFLCPE